MCRQTHEVRPQGERSDSILPLLTNLKATMFAFSPQRRGRSNGRSGNDIAVLVGLEHFLIQGLPSFIASKIDKVRRSKRECTLSNQAMPG